MKIHFRFARCRSDCNASQLVDISQVCWSKFFETSVACRFGCLKKVGRRGSWPEVGPRSTLARERQSERGGNKAGQSGCACVPGWCRPMSLVRLNGLTGRPRVHFGYGCRKNSKQSKTWTAADEDELATDRKRRQVASC